MLVDEVWGPPSWRRQQRQLAKAGPGGAGAGGLADLASCGGCEGCGGADIGGAGELVGALIVILAVALIAVVVVWAIMKLVAWYRERQSRPKPNGALLLPAKMTGRRRARGVIEAEELVPSPFSDRHVAGWALELSCKRFAGSDIMLRDGMTPGFVVRLEDGRVAQIPAGMLRMARGGDEDSVDAQRTLAHLSTIDPTHVEDDPEDPIPFERAVATELRPGDRVELAADLQPTQAGYRDAGSVLVAADVPTIKKL